MKRAPVLIDENKAGIAILNDTILAIQKSTALVAELLGTVKSLQIDFACVPTWRKEAEVEILSQKLRPTTLEGWRCEAALVITQAVTTLRFAAFVNFLTSEVEVLDDAPCPKFAFDDFVEA